MNVGERIKQRRLELGLSQDELAKKVGYKSRSSINKIELSRDLPLRKVELMAKALDTTPAYLMGWAGVDYQVSAEENILIETVSAVNESHNKRMTLYAAMLKEVVNRQLLDAADGCTDQQKQVAIDMLNTFKRKE